MVTLFILLSDASTIKETPENTFNRNKRDVESVSSVNLTTSFETIEKFREFIQEETNEIIKSKAYEILRDIVYNTPLSELCGATTKCGTGKYDQCCYSYKLDSSIYRCTYGSLG